MNGWMGGWTRVEEYEIVDMYHTMPAVKSHEWICLLA